MTAIAAVRVRGSMETRTTVERTLYDLKLTRKNHCIFLKESPSAKGMLLHAKDFITWGVVDAKTVEELLRRRGESEGGKRLTDEYVAKNSAFKTISELAQAVAEAKAALKDVKGLKPVLRLSPPRKGFDGTIKLAFPKGALGNRKEKIGELLLRMA
ncbi:MAG: 50S ribosomal protein L30 [Candidatus Micrarchaeota archaeon]